MPSTEIEDPTEKIITTQDDNGTTSLPAVTKCIEGQINTTQTDFDLFEYDVHIGDLFYVVKRNIEDRILYHQYCVVVWKDAEGYKIAIKGNGHETIDSVVQFSENLELLEASGIELIQAIDSEEQEKWIGKTEEEFVAQYGPCHYDFGSGIYIPCYIADTGTIYWLDFDQGERDVIKQIHSFSLKDLSTK